MALAPLAAHQLAEAVLGCVCVALDAVPDDVPGHPGCPCRVCVVPGESAWDSCADPCTGEAGGQLTVNIARMWPTSRFPEPDNEVRGLRGCVPAATTAVELVVTVLRCAPLPTADGCPPDCDQLAEAARIVHVDAVTVLNAVTCCLPGTAPGRRGRRFVMGQQRTIGPQGGCVGVEQRLTAALPGCAPCPGGDSP
ncbi:hypothetical protein [Streptomyces sulphureus]|uniref:hypothetical protein n=1 Tax=Streptomyces sulphureus TaxID=47758 RepID=UPI00036AFBE4|nr:hypothetical protein [Streptomyces sulphureus]